jgi:hypothetical protein
MPARCQYAHSPTGQTHLDDRRRYSRNTFDDTHVGALARYDRQPENFNVRNGGRTWARTKDPLIKSQLISLIFQRVFRDYQHLYRNGGPAPAIVCRKAKRSAAQAGS